MWILENPSDEEIKKKNLIELETSDDPDITISREIVIKKDFSSGKTKTKET